jgi:hypothetical protein
MSKYRLKSNFGGTWDIETKVDGVFRYNDLSTMDSNGNHPTKTEKVREWQVKPFDSELTYAEAKKRIERKMARDAFVPVILVPPFPEHDPNNPPNSPRKRFLGIF